MSQLNVQSSKNFLTLLLVLRSNWNAATTLWTRWTSFVMTDFFL